ncbi:TIGR00645 family protein [Microbacterium betulae]|uniref:UPF0114 protein N8K70_15500 n=1 Tax=Microbacterium betulae TaxID=2981139 RepID=A0AA97FIR7_9MICO|nr:TIGR00645 family protein [Microbacterium sp. AB]WOF22779.1 TIGR00645 family protein [Microbacterium sp. AB]
MTAQTDPSDIPASPRRRPGASGALGYFIFASRWLQAPLYVGLIVAQLVYVIVFMIDLWHLIETVFHDITQLNEATIMLAVLGLIDVVMIANLLIMVIMGGYEIFVSRLRVNDHPDQPDWLNHVNANVLKVKLAISIISISSIHLLRTFIEVGDIGSSADESVTGETYTTEGVFWQVVIHLAFILSALALAWIDKLSTRYPSVEPSELPATVR